MVISMSIRRKTAAPMNRAQVIIKKATATLSVTLFNEAHLSITEMITKAGIRENNDRRSIECFPRINLHSITIHRYSGGLSA